jgi:hypothetical protein
MIARLIVDTPADIQAWARNRADRKLQNLNRMNKTQQEEFVKMS